MSCEIFGMLNVIVLLAVGFLEFRDSGKSEFIRDLINEKSV